MKKTLQILFFSVLSVGAFAQHKTNLKQTEGPKAIQKIDENAPSKIDRSKQFPASSPNRVVVFHETFENDFNGSTSLGAWETAHSLTGVASTQGSMWSIGTPTYVNVYGGGPLISASPAKFALWDGAAYAAQYPSTILPANSSYSGYLTSPSLDLSELESAVVSFQQVFRYCCMAGSPVSVDVTIDNGTTWTRFDALGTAVEGANIASANPLNTAIDISCIAAGESNVKLRFSYNAANAANYTHYYWGIDEVQVYTNDNVNDLFVSELYNGDVVEDWEFRVTPEEQIRSADDGGVIVGVRTGNKGTAAHSDVVVRFDFVNAAGDTVFTFISPEFELASALTDPTCPHVESVVELWDSGFVPTELGTYTLKARVYSGAEESESTLADNSISETIVFNDISEYGHDGDTTADFQFQIGSRFVNPDNETGPRDQGGWGSHFSFVNPGSSAHGVTVRFGSSTVAGVEFNAVLIRHNANTTALSDGTLVGNSNYETTASWLTNHGGEPLFFAYNNSLPVAGVFEPQPTPVQVIDPAGDNFNYVGAIWRQSSGMGQLSVLAQSTVDADLSSVAWEKTGDGDFTWFHFQEYNYAVRLILSAPYVNHTPVGVDEVENTASFSVYPNPAVNEARVAFNLPESKFIAYEVRDLQGRLMDTDNIGRFGAGQNSFALNVSSYPAGNYIVGLVIDGKQIITQQISVVR